jgi:hypothetical protein
VLRRPEAAHFRNLVNSLKLKEFSVSTAPEVGRIIDIQNLQSTLSFAFLSTSCPNTWKSPHLLYRRDEAKEHQSPSKP